MQIPGTSATDPSFASVNPYASQELDRDAFMQLLVTQLANQDPLEPVKNEEFVAQLANFSSLEQLETLNDNILGMTALNHSNALLSQLTQGSALIGKEVKWLDPETGESFSGIVDTVKIEDGFALLNVGGDDIPLVNVTEILNDTASGTSADA